MNCRKYSIVLCVCESQCDWYAYIRRHFWLLAQMSFCQSKTFFWMVNKSAMAFVTLDDIACWIYYIVHGDRKRERRREWRWLRWIWMGNFVSIWYGNLSMASEWLDILVSFFDLISWNLTHKHTQFFNLDLGACTNIPYSTVNLQPLILNDMQFCLAMALSAVWY